IWKFEMPLWIRAGLGGLGVGLIALMFPEVLGVGYAATDQALSLQFSLTMLLMLIVAKTVATSITLACRFSVGVFSPSLYLGAMTGAAFGLIATSLVPDTSSSASLYAILGMGGVAAAVLGAPISTTMIVFELTGGFNMAIALLATISISAGLTHACLGPSYFHWQLHKRGLFLHEGQHRAILRHIKVADFMAPLDDTDAEAVLDPTNEPPLKPSDTLEHALRVFNRVGSASLFVVATDDATRVIGRVQRMAAISAYNKALIEAHVEEHQ
ncbi:MAG: chloride channel protein, partial [Alphaproteobacteria bacterium]|nr:chloride channel protein [Alphaproteobacteria bacterium]